VTYYAAVTAQLPQQEINKIGGALGNWSNHNLLVNCSNIVFTAQTSASLYTVLGNMGQHPVHQDWRSANQNFLSLSGYVASAETTFYWGAVGGGVPAWNRNGTNAYYNAVQAAAVKP